LKRLIINNDKFIVQVNPIVDYAMRGLCRKPYYNHSKGCPNFRKRSDCPPFAPLFDKYIDMSKPIYVIYNIFDFKSHIEKMKLKHPEWSEHQLKCVLYWQNSARKQLRLKCEKFLKEYEGLDYEIITCPEAMGVNLTATMQNIGIILEWPPVNIAYQIAIAGIKK